MGEDTRESEVNCNLFINLCFSGRIGMGIEEYFKCFKEINF